MSTATLLELRWAAPESDAAIIGYQILAGASAESAAEVDRVDALRWITSVDWTGARTFVVRAIDELGGLGDPGTVTVGEGAVTADAAPTAGVEVDAFGNAVIRFTPFTEPQIQDYELRTGSAFETAAYVDRTTGATFTLPLLTTVGKTYWIKARFTDGTYSVIAYSVTFDGDALAPVTGLAWTINQSDLRFTWNRVPGAAQYLALYEDGGVTRIKVSATPEAVFHVPKWASVIRIIAVASDGSLSPPLDEEIAVAGQYRLNEVITAAIPIASGRYVNMAWNGSTVFRAGLRGLTPSAPYAANINDGDLYTLGYNIENVPASQFEATPAAWFRDRFWENRSGAFESASIDFGSIRTGRVLVTITKTIDYVGDANVSAWAHVNAGYLGASTAQDLIDTRAFLTVALLVSTDNTTWRPVQSGDWITARYVRLAVEVAMASPLTEVRVTAGTLTLDVEDIIETGSKTGVTNAGSAITFTKPFSVVSVVIGTARGAARVHATNVTAAGCTLWTDSATPTQVDYFVKGY